MNRTLPLYERARPQSFEDVVGQDNVMKRLSLMRERGGLGGRAFWVTGKSGCGKTTIARLIAKEVADEYAILEMDAQRVTLEDIRGFDRTCRCRPLGKGYHAFIMNEAHRLSSKVVSELQTVLESSHVQRNSTWLFTTTLKGATLFGDKFDAIPFLSRAIKLELDGRGSELDFAVRARTVAQQEGMDGAALEKYLDLIRSCNGNLRAAYNAIESGEMLID